MGVTSSCSQPCKPMVQPCSGAMTQSYELADPGFFDLYDIGDLIGSGAFGQVRKCWSVGEGDDCSVAVKVIDARLNSAHITASDEATILQSVRHPHIVEMIDVFEEGRWLFVVEERIVGGELFAAIADSFSPVDEGCIAAVGRQLLLALHHLHERSIIHRDVKAENIMLSSKPSITGNWHVKLVDFGLAMHTNDDSFFLPVCGSRPQIICGTLYYCAPEIFLDKYGPKVDVWATGVMLYLALYGRFPFYDKDPDLVEMLICEDGREPEWSAQHKIATAYQTYQPSQLAIDCLSSLLQHDPQDRVSSEEALDDEWFRKSGPAGLSNPIPLDIRLKAARAAARPPVDVERESERTAALMVLKARKQNADNPSCHYDNLFRPSVRGASARNCMYPADEDAVEIGMDSDESWRSIWDSMPLASRDREITLEPENVIQVA